MVKNDLTGSVAFSTLLVVEKIQRIADACGVTLTLVDTRFRPDYRWVNDFEVEGAPGKIDRFMVKVQDIEIS